MAAAGHAPRYGFAGRPCHEQRSDAIGWQRFGRVALPMMWHSGGQTMNQWDAIGYFAAAMVFVAFGMKEMVALRIVAMVSNLAFVAYGLGLHLPPVWLLHAVLFPLNGWRLVQATGTIGRCKDAISIARRSRWKAGSFPPPAPSPARRR